MIRKDVFTLKINQLAKLFSAQMDGGKIKLFYDILSKELSEAYFLVACRHLEKTFKLEFGRKFPTPADFIDCPLLPKVHGPEELFEMEWAAWSEANRRLGANEHTEAFKKTVLVSGDPFIWNSWTVNEWKWRKKDMKEAYLNFEPRAHQENELRNTMIEMGIEPGRLSSPKVDLIE